MVPYTGTINLRIRSVSSTWTTGYLQTHPYLVRKGTAYSAGTVNVSIDRQMTVLHSQAERSYERNTISLPLVSPEHHQYIAVTQSDQLWEAELQRLLLLDEGGGSSGHCITLAPPEAELIQSHPRLTVNPCQLRPQPTPPGVGRSSIDAQNQPPRQR